MVPQPRPGGERRVAGGVEAESRTGQRGRSSGISAKARESWAGTRTRSGMRAVIAATRVIPSRTPAGSWSARVRVSHGRSSSSVMPSLRVLHQGRTHCEITFVAQRASSIRDAGVSMRDAGHQPNHRHRGGRPGHGDHSGKRCGGGKRRCPEGLDDRKRGNKKRGDYDERALLLHGVRRMDGTGVGTQPRSTELCRAGATPGSRPRSNPSSCPPRSRSRGFRRDSARRSGPPRR